MIQSVDELLVAHWLARLPRDLFEVVGGELGAPSPRELPLLLHKEHQSVHIRIHRDVHFEPVHLDLLIQFEWQLDWSNEGSCRGAMRRALLGRDLVRGNRVVVLKAAISGASVLDWLSEDAPAILTKVLR